MRLPAVFPLCMALVLSGLVSTTSESAIPESERAALLVFYEVTGGDSWLDNSGWLGAPGSECEWFGVFCDDQEEHVIELYLESNQLEGPLPVALVELPYLEALWLGRADDEQPPNRLGGPIPAELGDLERLRILGLWDNQLSGPIPPDLGNLHELVYLDLDGNHLEGPIPPELGGLGQLQQMWIGAAGLGGAIPPELGNLSELRVLVLWGNQLSGSIPPALGALLQLEYLALSWNPMHGIIPAELGNLRNLRGLFLWDMGLEGEIPAEIGDLAELQELSLGANRLAGPLPRSLGRLAQLVEMNLPGNRFSGEIPAELGQLEHLRSLRLDWNQLSGDIPPELGNLTGLRTLGLAGNRLTGVIPVSFGQLENLEALFLPHNALNGQIPRALAALGELQVCELQWNQLSGPIPAELGQLDGLVVLDLSHNHLEGPVPPQLGSLAQLNYLHLRGNRLRGALPAELALLDKLVDGEGLDLRWNALVNRDPDLERFLNRTQWDGDWRSTQTVPPGGLELLAVTPVAAEIRWDPIPYSWDPGGTRVLLAAILGGPYTLHGTTASKEQDGVVIDGLDPQTQYYLVLQSVTEPHDMNPNLVESLLGEEIGFMTGGDDDCSLSCEAGVVATVMVDELVTFTGRVAGSNCTDAIVVSWQFGDGASAEGEQVDHSYSSTGRFPWIMGASSGDARCSSTGTISVFEPDTECGNQVCELGESAFNCDADCGFAPEETGRAGASSAASAVPAAVGGVGGVGGTFWVSEAMLHNPGHEDASMILRFTPDGKPAERTIVGPVTLGAGDAVFFADFVGEVFEVDGNGSVLVDSDVPVMVVSRTFNQQPDGTYGQFLGAVPANRVFSVGDVAVLPGLSENEAFRSNVLVQDVSQRGSTVELSVYSSDGALVGSSELQVAPGTKLQKRLLNLGYSELDHGFATLQVTGGGQVVAIASMVDEGTGDAMTVDAVHEDQVLFGDAEKRSATAAWLSDCGGDERVKATGTVDFSWSPSSPVVGDPVSFANLSAGTIISYSWNFGDGGTSTDENPVHTYLAAGTYPVTLAVSTADFGSSFSTKTISVQESVSFDSSYLVAVVARAEGAASTRWRSDLWLLNPLSAAQDVRLQYYADDGSLVRLHDLVIPGGQQVAVEDVVGTLFAAAGDGKGSLHVHASQGVMVSSRTYNLGDDGSFGQAVPALGADDLVAVGRPGKLLKMKNNQSTRCNVGFAEMDGLGAEVKLSLYAVSGAGVEHLGSKRYSVAAATVRQVNRVFADLGVADDHDAAFAVVELISGGRVYAYASNVDGRTGDGEFIPALVR